MQQNQKFCMGDSEKTLTLEELVRQTSLSGASWGKWAIQQRVAVLHALRKSRRLHRVNARSQGNIMFAQNGRMAIP
jgi:hypothetical protein